MCINIMISVATYQAKLDTIVVKTFDPIHYINPALFSDENTLSRDELIAELEKLSDQQIGYIKLVENYTEELRTAYGEEKWQLQFVSRGETVNDVSEINDINKKIAWTKRFIKFTEELVKKFSDMSDEVEKIRVKIRTMLKVV
jgi:hypothetical protein